MTMNDGGNAPPAPRTRVVRAAESGRTTSNGGVSAPSSPGAIASPVTQRESSPGSTKEKEKEHARPLPAPRKGQNLVVGIAYDLKADFEAAARRAAAEGDLPEDAFEEYDSEATVTAIEGALSEAGYKTKRLGSGRAFLSRVMRDGGDIVFNIAEGYGTRSREAHVPSALEMLGLPYTHSDPLTLSLTLDKAMAKRVVASSGVPTPRFAVIEHVTQVKTVDLAWPVIAKPLYEGSSMGVRNKSRVATRRELAELVSGLLRDYKEPVLVEEFASGPEFTVGILGTGSGAKVLGAMEIVPRNVPIDEFVYSLEMKRNFAEEIDYHVPPRRETGMLRAVEMVALSAYRALGCRDVGRVDVRIGADGEPKFLEVNPLPGLNPVTGDLVILARGNGISYPELIARIVDLARERQSL